MNSQGCSKFVLQCYLWCWNLRFEIKVLKGPMLKSGVSPSRSSGELMISEYPAQTLISLFYMDFYSPFYLEFFPLSIWTFPFHADLSSKIQTNSTLDTSGILIFVRFLEETEDTKKRHFENK